MNQVGPLTAKDRNEQTRPERTHGGVVFTPRVDIYENDKQLVLCADLPGVRPEDVELRYERGELLLHGHVQAPKRQGSALLNEYEEGDFYRSFTIHESIDSTKIEAQCKNGVLTVQLPKVPAAQPRQIAVRGS
jgi:HSP20 family protein